MMMVVMIALRLRSWSIRHGYCSSLICVCGVKRWQIELVDIATQMKDMTKFVVLFFVHHKSNSMRSSNGWI